MKTKSYPSGWNVSSQYYGGRTIDFQITDDDEKVAMKELKNETRRKATILDRRERLEHLEERIIDIEADLVDFHAQVGKRPEKDHELPSNTDDGEGVYIVLDFTEEEHWKLCEAAKRLGLKPDEYIERVVYRKVKDLLPCEPDFGGAF